MASSTVPVRLALAVAMLTAMTGCGPSGGSQPAVPSADPVPPAERLAQALTASAAATSFHLDATGESTNRPVTVLPASMMGGPLHLVGDVDATHGVGDFVLTIASSPGRFWHLRSVRQAAGNPVVLLESTTKPGQWISNPGVIFSDGLGAFTGPSPSDPGAVFAQLAANIDRIGADGSVTRLADQPCGSSQCAILEWDGGPSFQRLFCKGANPSACPITYLVDFAVDSGDQRIARIVSAFRREGVAGEGTIAFTNWGQPLTIAVPPEANVAPGDGNLH
jgi:hypothetical protein